MNFVLIECINQDYNEDTKKNTIIQPVELNQLDSTDFIPNKLQDYNDSAFFDKIKNFFFKEIGYELQGDLYSKYKNAFDFDYLIIISLHNKVEMPKQFKPDIFKKRNHLDRPYIICGKDIDNFKKIESECNEKGYHTSCCHTTLNSKAYITEELTSLSQENKVHAVFHELMHNYISQNKIRMQYNYEEALCEVIGNYFTLKFAKTNNEIDNEIVEREIIKNEKFYQCINYYIFEINRGGRNVDSLNNECEKKIKTIFENTDFSEKMKREDYVNNAYLLFQNSYSEKYFILKKMYLEQPTITEFIDKIPIINSSNVFLQIPYGAILESVKCTKNK
ncbi:MAG: hypothetical protein ABIJ97_01220 [Bacteroidota bacterium]